VRNIFYSPTLHAVAYRGRHQASAEEEVTEIVAVECLEPIPGESRIGSYDPETGDLQEDGPAF